MTYVSFSVATNHLHFGGGSEVFAIILLLVDRTNNAQIVLFGSSGLDLGTKTIEFTFNCRASASRRPNTQKAFVGWTFSSETGLRRVEMVLDSPVDAETNATIRSRSRTPKQDANCLDESWADVWNVFPDECRSLFC